MDLNRQRRELGLPRSLGIEDYLGEVGIDVVGTRFRNLHGDRAWHFGFPDGYFLEEAAAWLSHENHPTWTAARAGSHTGRFGGTGEGVCNNCGEQRHLLLALDSIPEGLPITGLSKVTFETCLSCLGWEEVQMFYRHTDTGRTRCLAKRGTKPPQFPVGPLKPTPVVLTDLGSRWRWQSWSLSNSRENLNRLGGAPAWVQSADYPLCPSCKRTMRFLLQLDSNLPVEADDESEWLWGAGGVCYGFWCNGCKVSAFLWQCT